MALLGVRVATALGVDYERNRLFYEPSLAPDDYRRWLAENSVGWVALAGEATTGRPHGRPPWCAPVCRSSNRCGRTAFGRSTE